MYPIMAEAPAEQQKAVLLAVSELLGREGELAGYEWSVPTLDAAASGPVGYPVADFYMTNAICRASPTMQRCSAEITHGETLAEAAE